ncbi:MAG: gamma-glutamyltransferase family protein [Vulcanimicrobiaceae bacterium]
MQRTERHAWSSRAIARSARGMVASPHAQATVAGAEVLRRGGTAVDAAVASSAVLAVVYPASCGLGGDLLALVYEPRIGAALAYNGSGRAPQSLGAADLRARGYAAIPLRSPFTVTAPGCVRAWADLLGAHGRLGFDELLAPAERYARDGYVVTDLVADSIARNAALLAEDPEASALLLAGGGLRAGELALNEPLARVFADLRRRGPVAFYEGAVAAAICARLNPLGNPMTPDDLAAQRTELGSPLGVAWHGREVLAHPPNSQGLVAPMVLGALRADGARDELAWTHLAIEAIKEAFALRDAEFADPDAMRVLPASFVADDALRALRARLDPARARPREPAPGGGGTIAIVAADGEGRAISLIQSLYMNFGSGLVAPGTGIFLQNRGAYFRLEAGHPNELAGGKRPLHTLSPVMVLRDGRPELVFGTMGGDGQPQTHVQVLHAIYEREIPLQAAIDAPRFVYGRDSESPFVEALRVESRLDPSLVEGLRALGHKLEVLGPYEHALGHGHAVAIDRERGTFAGGCDPRADSLALGP